MSTRSVRIGPSKIYFPISTSSVVAGFSGGPTLAWTASTITVSDILVNSENPPLDTSAQYSFIIAPLGEDKVNGGYTIGAGSPIAGPVTISNNLTQGVCLQILASSLTSNLTMAGGIMVFMKKNSSNFIPHSIVYVDPDGNDFSTTIVNEPIPGAVSYTSTQIQSSTPDSTTPFGSRVPYGYQYVALSPTTQGVTVNFDANQVPVSPDTGPDYNAVAGRGLSFTFQLLANAIKNVIQANAGNYVKYTLPSSTKTVEVANMANQTAVALFTGCKPWKMVMPPDANRVSEVQVFYATITQNQSPGTMAWTKTATTPVTFNVQTINVDTLLDDIAAVSSYSIRA